MREAFATSRILVLLFVLFASASASASAAAQPDPVVGALTRHGVQSADYRKLVEGRPDLDHRLRGVASRMGAGAAPALAREEKRQIFAQLGPVANPLSFDLLLAALQFDDPEIQERVKVYLLEPSFRGLVRGSAARLRPLLSDYAASEQSCELLGLLELPEEQRGALLAQSKTPWHVRARLGDSVAEAQILKDFAEAPPLGKRHLARKLFYANTPAAWQAFATAIGSTQSYVDYQGQERSQAFELIQAYGDYFDSPSFKPPAYKTLLYIEGPEFAAKAATYLQQIGHEIETAHGVPTQVRPTFFVRNEVEPHEYVVPNE